jgi:eukaryotic-like serine/threonine-protein kinase
MPQASMPQASILNTRYILEEHLGSGGMAVVYRARDQLLERTVAIKILKRNYSADATFRERFRQEAKAVANLSHPNIVTVYDFGFDKDQLFIIMEYVPGTDLKTLITDPEKLSIDETMLLILQACAGIGYAHRSGLVHCDTKPQNMLVTPDRRLKVVDFGIARALASIRPDEKHKIVWGSPAYFSSEQAAGAPHSTASDVYSMGVVLFEMVTGQLPFIASSAEELSRMHREDLPPSPRRINPEIPAPLEKVILKSLSKDPAQRYQNADEFGEALATSLGSYPNPLTIDFPINGTTGFRSLAEAEAGRYPSPYLEKGHANGRSSHTATPVVQAVPTSPTAANPMSVDWITWLLALLALIAIGGLIPFWLWIYYLIYPPL